ncbi:FkbM family methyltransferase [Mucilaginibacter sp. McL0603]|uniref:FkbM family methyltransferase n=1 Tax=Mucilaginibacter sp. McL0603 TaxID=3415670 RepID=UPI003CE8F9BF
MAKKSNAERALIIKAKIKKLILRLTGKVKHLKKGIKLKSVWYGNQYGGFYVYPDLLNEDSIIYSFGIGRDISFDTTIIKNHNCKVFGFDPTPKSIEWIKGQDVPPKFTFHDLGISDKSGFCDFYFPKNPDNVSGSIVVQNNIDVCEKTTVKMQSIKDIMTGLAHTHIDILKMDIEGAEYSVIENILDSNASIDQILIEFHDRFVENGKAKTKHAIRYLNDKGFEIFAISDSCYEISFINKNKILAA